MGKIFYLTNSKWDKKENKEEKYKKVETEIKKRVTMLEVEGLRSYTGPYLESQLVPNRTLY